MKTKKKNKKKIKTRRNGRRKEMDRAEARQYGIEQKRYTTKIKTRTY